MPLTPEQTSLFQDAIDRRATDIHLVAGQPPCFRINGELVRREGADPLTVEAIEALVLPPLTPFTQAALREGRVAIAEASEELGDCQFHIVAFRSAGILSATIRREPMKIPSIDGIGNDQITLFRQLATLDSGLILNAGPPGCGKTTTVFAILKEILRTRPVHLLMIRNTPRLDMRTEPGDPSLISYIVVGQDVPDYESAAQLVMRGIDPDVVFFDDLPNIETVRHALTLARTGQLVFANADANSAPEMLATLCRAAPDDVPQLLAEYLAVATSQRLFRRATGKGRVAAYEVLRNTAEIREALWTNPTASALYAAMEADTTGTMRTITNAVEALVTSGDITRESADASLRGRF